MPVEVSRLKGDCVVAQINEAMDREGAVIIEDFFSQGWLDRYNGEVQSRIDNHHRTYTGVEQFDDFLGYKTVRLQGLAAKTPSFINALIDRRLLAVRTTCSCRFAPNTFCRLVN